MIRQKHLILIIYLIVWGIPLCAQITYQKYEHLNTEDGLSQSVVTCIFQDSKGFMWFGTQDGINKYDGYKFSVYIQRQSKTEKQADNHILSICEDSLGVLWFGTENGGVIRLDPRYETLKRFIVSDSVGLNDNSVRSIVCAPNGELYFGTRKGLFSFDNQLNKFSKEAISSLQNKSCIINTLLIDKNENLWIGTESGLIKKSLKLKNETLFKHEPENKNSISNNNILDLLETKEGVLWIGTYNGINIFNKTSNTFRIPQINSAYTSFVTTGEINSLAQDHKGNIWIGTFGYGNIIYQKKYELLEQHTNIPDNEESLSNDYINDLFVDKSGLLWVGTYGGGINKLDLVNIHFGHISRNPKIKNTLPSNEIFAISEKDKTVWIGTDNGLCKLNAIKAKYTTFKAQPGVKGKLQSDIIYALLLDNESSLWVGTSNGGLHKITYENLKDNSYYFSNINDANNDSAFFQAKEVYCIYQDKQDMIWCGTNAGLFKLNTKGEIINSWQKVPGDTSSLCHNEVYCIKQIKDGRFLIGTFDGFNVLDLTNNTFIRYGHFKKKKNQNLITVYSIYEDSKNNIWIGTDNGGLIHVQPDSLIIKNYTTNDGLPDNVIYGILEDKQHNLWVSTNKGISKVVPTFSGEKLTFINYNTSNWLECNTFNIGAYYKNSEGILFFGCDEGLIFFDPSDIKSNSYVPPIELTDFQLFFKPVQISPHGDAPLLKHISYVNEIVLNHKQNVLKFSFSALSYIQNYKNTYAYMLEGLDEDWIYANNNISAIYTYIPPGKYTFRVKAANNEGVWNNTGKAIKVIIKPPFYKTVWFYILVGICILGAVLLFIHIRTRGLRKIKHFLEIKVKERTKEVMMQKEELQVTLDNLRSAQNQLIESEKMASLGQLTAGVAHEINNPINFVSANIGPLRKDIEEIIQILFEYERIVKQNDLEGKFTDVEKLKEQMDYVFLLEEIHNLLKGIDEGALRTAEIVKGLRNFSRLDENELKFANINEGIESTLLILRNKIKNRIQVHTDFGEIPGIQCFPGKINQVFMNIITNAIQAIPDKGDIYIKTETVDYNVRVTIKDTGTGMPEQVKKKIFEPFFTTKDIGKGTGLGLSISYGIIERHKGSIIVNSEPENGTEFIIDLPIEQKEIADLNLEI